jgi:hypothetical protein
MRWVGHVARTERREMCAEMNLRGVKHEGLYWIHLAVYRVQWRALNKRGYEPSASELLKKDFPVWMLCQLPT